MSDHTNDLAYADDAAYKMTDGPFEPTWQSLQSFQCLEWFRDAKLVFWSIEVLRRPRCTATGMHVTCIWQGLISIGSAGAPMGAPKNLILMP